MKKSKFKILPGGLIDKPGSAKSYKTGSWRSERPIWNKNKCIQCLICVNFCPDDAIPIKNGKRRETNFDYCKGCGICAQECPVKVIIMKKE